MTLDQRDWQGDPAMDEARFRILAAAYGADLRRWPTSEIEAAGRFAGEHLDVCAEVLSEAAVVDSMLDASPAPVVPMRLSQRVLALAPDAVRGAARSWPQLRKLLWVGGLGWAAAAGAGVVFGVSLGEPLLSEPQTDAAVEQALMVDLDEPEMFG